MLDVRAGKTRKKQKKMQIMVGTMGLQIFKKGSGRLSATFLYQHLRTWNAKLDGLMIVTMDNQTHFFYTDKAAEIGVAMRLVHATLLLIRICFSGRASQ